MSSNQLTQRFLQPWQMAVSATVCAYIALCFATGTLKLHHWFLLIAVPAAALAQERGRKFFRDFWPLFAFWLVYDRLRLIQPFLLDRVSVRWPYELERWAFGWIAGGDLPAHAGREWLGAHLHTFAGSSFSFALQFIYFSHLFVLPMMLYYFWHRGHSRPGDRLLFINHIRSFTALHFTGMFVYVVLPVAPPWWVSLHHFARPTTELIAQTKMTEAMDGAMVQGVIQSAAVWFAAVPSLHGAYPVLMLLLALKIRNRFVTSALILYTAAMFASTVLLNQHYIIDLVAGALLAFVCYFAFGRKTFESVR